jgi:hypothetical protein
VVVLNPIGIDFGTINTVMVQVGQHAFVQPVLFDFDDWEQKTLCTALSIAKQ